MARNTPPARSSRLLNPKHSINASIAFYRVKTRRSNSNLPGTGPGELRPNCPRHLRNRTIPASHGCARYCGTRDRASARIPCDPVRRGRTSHSAIGAPAKSVPGLRVVRPMMFDLEPCRQCLCDDRRSPGLPLPAGVVDETWPGSATPGRWRRKA